MAKAIKGEVPFQADGKDYTFLLDLNALCEAEAHVSGLMDGAADLSSVRSIRAVFWAGLIQHHPGLTLHDAGRVMQDLGLKEAAALVVDGMKASFPAGGEEDASPQKAPGKAGTGK